MLFQEGNTVGDAPTLSRSTSRGCTSTPQTSLFFVQIQVKLLESDYKRIILSYLLLSLKASTQKNKQTCNTAVFVLTKTETQSHCCEDTLIFLFTDKVL